MEMEILSLVLTLVGLGISGAAWMKAKSAKEAVGKALDDRNAHDDLERIRSLSSSINDAKDAVSPWVTGMPIEQRQGRNKEEDLAQLSAVVDKLRTKSPLGANSDLNNRILQSADVLDKQFNVIGGGASDENHWKVALSEIQQIIPRLEQAERETRDKQISS